jgi:hypothetical protein
MRLRKVSAPGAVLSQHFNGVVTPYSAGIHYDAGTGLVYTDGGQAIQPSNGSVVGSYGASGIAVPDSTLNRLFILGQAAAQAGTLNYTVESFNQSTFASVASVTIDNVVGTPTALIRWGTNGLAFTTRVGASTDFRGAGPGQMYVISGDFVHPATDSSQTSLMQRLPPVSRTWNSGGRTVTPSQSTVVNVSPLKR